MNEKAKCTCEHSQSAKLYEELYKSHEKILEIKENELVKILSKYNVSEEDKLFILNIFYEYKENVLSKLRDAWFKNQTYDILSLLNKGV